MKKSKRRSRFETINDNKDILDEYLSNFKNSEKYYKMFDDSDIDFGSWKFPDRMKKLIGMPQVGSTTINYWVSRGWSREESEPKRTKIKRGNTSPMTIDFWMKKGLSKDESVYKINSFRKCNIEYWIERGYSNEDSELKVSEFQLSNSKILSEKKKERPQDYLHTYSTKIEYYLYRGMSVEEAEKALSDRQTTFSKEICIEKYGENKGLKVWTERQEKWQKTISELDGFLKVLRRKI